MARIPETTSDETINQLWEEMQKLFGTEYRQAEAVQAAMSRIDRLMRQPEIDLRGCDIRYAFKGSFRGRQIWVCWDAKEGQEVWGEGESKEMALVDFMDKRESQATAAERELDEAIDDALFDRDLEDHDAR